MIPYNRISDLFDDFYGIRISPATIKKAENECFNNLEHFDTGVIALIEKAIRYGFVEIPNVKTPDGLIHLQNGIDFSERDLKEAGKAIGAIRAGHIILCAVAGIEMSDIDTAYMAGAAGTYMRLSN